MIRDAGSGADVWSKQGDGWGGGWLVADTPLERPFFGMEMVTAESRYDKISDFPAECQRLFGHLLCAAQLSSLSETHGESTCAH